MFRDKVVIVTHYWMARLNWPKRMTSIKLLIVSFACLILLSCGGGGSDSVSIPDPVPTTPTPPPTPSPPPVNNPIEDVEIDVAALQAFAGSIAEMSFNELISDALSEIQLRDPESIVGLGLESEFELSDLSLTPIDFGFQLTTLAMWQEVLDRLNQLDRTTLSAQDAVSFDVLHWLATEQSSLSEFIFFDYQATYFGTSVPRQTQLFFSDLHPLANSTDIANYIARLRLVDDKIDQLIANLQIMEDNGVIEPQITMQVAINVHQAVVDNGVTSSPYYVNFVQKIDALQNVLSNARDNAKSEARTIIGEQINPAYNRLTEFLNEQISRAPADIGVGQFENGADYYLQRLRFHTTTDMTPEQIHELGLQELDRIHAELRTRFDQLGYPQNESLQALFQRVASDGGFIPAADVVPAYEALIEDAEQRMASLFSRQPQVDVQVVGGPIGGFYVRASLDGSRPGSFFATNVNNEPYFTMPTLAYHEAMPGHHMQIALAQETDLPLFRRNLSATGYIEGWGLYAERIAGEYGWYDNDIYGDIGRLNFEALRAARLVVDTGIHAFGWDFDTATSFFQENVGTSLGNAQSNIARYSVYTGQATAYMVGMLKIIELREQMRTAQGESFSIIEFHDLVLDSGAVPLTVLESMVANAID